MAWKLPRLQFGLRGLLLVVFLSAIGAWLYTNRPERMRAFRNQQARARIDPYELAIAGDGDPSSVPPELVAILGDSRLKHWGPAGGVKLLAGEQVASSGWDEQVRVWDINTGRQLHKFDAKSFTASGDRKLLFLAAPDGTIRCWDVATTKVLKTLGEPRTADRVGLEASTDGRILVAETVQRDRTREITVWDIPQAQVIHSFRPAKPGSGSQSVSHDGQYFTWEDENQIRLSACATGEVLHTFGPIMEEDGVEGQYVVGQVEFSAEGGKLFVGSAMQSVIVFDRTTGKELERIGPSGSSVHQFALGFSERALTFGGQSPLTVHRRNETRHRRSAETTLYGGGQIGTVDWHGNMIAADSDETISMWDAYLLQPRRLAGGETKAIRRLAFHPDGKHLLTGNSAGQVEVWEIATWRGVRRWPAHFNAIETLTLSADGGRLVTASGDRTAVVWNPLTGAEVTMLRGMYKPGGIGISPDGAMIVGGVRDLMFGEEFEVFDSETGASIRKVGPIKHGIHSPPAWSRDGQRLAFMDQTHSLQIFDAANWKNLASLGYTRFGQQEVVAVWLSDNRRLVTTNWGKDEVHVLEVGKPLPVLTLNTGAGQAECVAVHPSEEWIAVCGRKTPVQLWHLPTSKLVKSWQIGPPAGVVSQVAFSPDGHYLAMVNGNGTVNILSLDGVLD